MTTHTNILWRRPKALPFAHAPCSETVDPATETLDPLRDTLSSQAIEKCLPKKSFIKLVGDHSGERIACLNGVIWITQSGNLDDVFLCAGESFTITQKNAKKGTILIQCLEETRLKITGPSAAISGWQVRPTHV